MQVTEIKVGGTYNVTREPFEMVRVTVLHVYRDMKGNLTWIVREVNFGSRFLVKSIEQFS